mmetsp:Transcript_22888/g.56501  ORF Transcript_22888/g.56501 Transcript_22888/m.56501 type:complete len:243 (+) Transcript_22888:228-956(+)
MSSQRGHPHTQTSDVSERIHRDPPNHRHQTKHKNFRHEQHTLCHPATDTDSQSVSQSVGQSVRQSAEKLAHSSLREFLYVHRPRDTYGPLIRYPHGRSVCQFVLFFVGSIHKREDYTHTHTVMAGRDSLSLGHSERSRIWLLLETEADDQPISFVALAPQQNVRQCPLARTHPPVPLDTDLLIFAVAAQVQCVQTRGQVGLGRIEKIEWNGRDNPCVDCTADHAKPPIVALLPRQHSHVSYF